MAFEALQSHVNSFAGPGAPAAVGVFSLGQQLVHLVEPERARKKKRLWLARTVRGTHNLWVVTKPASLDHPRKLMLCGCVSKSRTPSPYGWLLLRTF